MKFSKSAALAALAALTLATSVALAGCGGGANDTFSAGGATVVGVPEGAWAGTFDKGSNSAFEALVQGDGSTWIAYGNFTGDVFAVSGFLQGTGSGTNGAFTSPAMRNYGAGGIGIRTGLAATYVPGSRFDGTVDNFIGTVNFSGAPAAAFNYNTPAIVLSIAGTWSMRGLDGTATTMSIGGDGVLTGSAGACAITGTVVPSADGKNLFDVTTNLGAGCSPANMSGRGIAVWHRNQDTAREQLIIAAVSSDRSTGMGLVGNRFGDR